MISDRTIYVGLYLPETNGPVPAGILKLHRDGVAEEGAFGYGKRYLERLDALALNPGYLSLSAGQVDLPRRRLRDGGALNLTFKDALPDAWGRLVLTARNGWREPDEIDMLLQTNADRVGAMVFGLAPDALDGDGNLEAFDLPALADAAQRLQYDMHVTPEMRRLLLPGGSLGGARPKASVVENGELWMAKFPARDDEVDVQLLEACTLALAERCGIAVPQFRLAPLGEIHALVLRRFDRPGRLSDSRRIHFLSAAAFTDSPYESADSSYVSLARHLRQHGANVASDLEQLYRRMVFSMLVDNSDDHVKNHGVLHAGGGKYLLSPAYDLVPQLSNLGYAGMAIMDGRHEANLDLALDAAPHFGLTRESASRIVSELREGIDGWRPLFERMGATTPLLRRVQACFERQAKIVAG